MFTGFLFGESDTGPSALVTTPDKLFVVTCAFKLTVNKKKRINSRKDFPVHIKAWIKVKKGSKKN